jgi:hypothetical protein
VLLVVPYFIILVQQKKFKQILLLPVIPSLLAITFVDYYFKFGTFFAYLKYNGHLISTPAVNLFKVYAYAGDGHSAELYFLFYAIYGFGILQLWKKKEIFYFSAVYFVMMLFVFHMDLSRYMLPLAPFALLVGYDDLLSKKRSLLLLLLIPLVYTYSWGLIPHNQIVDWVWSDLVKVLAQ